VITDFDAVHSPIKGDTGEYLIFGKVPISKPAADLSPELAVYLGRWEGIDHMKIRSVMIVEEINALEGRALMWAGKDLQKPTAVNEIRFKVVPGPTPKLEWRANILVAPNHNEDVVYSVSYDREKEMLEGWIKPPSSSIQWTPYGPARLSRGQSYFIRKDPAKDFSDNQKASSKNFEIEDFEAVHFPVNGKANAYLIFGNIPVSPPAQELSPALTAFLGRWEGYDYSHPVKKDYKMVLVIQEISAQGGKAFLWLGTNLQYPSSIQEVHFSVLPGDIPAIEFDATFEGPTQGIRLVLDSEKKHLKSPDSSYRPLDLSRDLSFYVYKDYDQYLSSKRIYAKAYLNSDLARYGKGYLLYLPKGYEDNPTKTWPMIFFLHGIGDRGDNPNILAKASPFMMIREKKQLPCIIVAPLLKPLSGAPYFPIEYLDGVLTEVRSIYRVDPKRTYGTGLSLGGEAIYRLAIHHSEAFAAIAPLSAFLQADEISQLDRIVNVPIWAIHGSEDPVISLARGEQPVKVLKKMGGNIRFTILAGHDHDTWTDTYLDPKFYDWLLQHHRP
jgi:predicted esterase